MSGILICILSLLTGSVVGLLIGKSISGELQRYIMLLFGLICFGIAFSAISRMADLISVTISILLGGCMGYLLKLDTRIAGAAEKASTLIIRRKGESPAGNNELSTFIALICASSTGIVGSINAGISGDTSLLITKAVMDFPVACIFAVSLGMSACLIAIPEFALFALLFCGAGLISPYLSADSILNLNACGGFLVLTSGLKIFKINPFPTLNLLPVIILIVPVTQLCELIRTVF